MIHVVLTDITPCLKLAWFEVSSISPYKMLSKSESVKFSKIKLVICFSTDSPVKKYI